MKLLPLILHGGIQIPRHTALFSDALAVATLDVVEGGNVTINCSAAHNVAVGSAIAVSITDAETPNPITAASVTASGTILCTTTYPHNLAASPDPVRFRAFNEFAKVAGFTSTSINGIRDLVATPSPTTFEIEPGAEVVGPITLTGNEALKERLEYDVTGWHKATATTSTALTFATPATVARDYTVTAPTVVRNIRIYGAIDHEAAVRQLTIDGDLLTIDKGHMFILPRRVRAKGRFDLTDVAPGADYRQVVEDGFTVLVFLPSTGSAAHVKAIDKGQGEVFKAVLRAFAGLRISRGELCASGHYVATFESHQGGMHSNNAVYAHEYVFDAPFTLLNEDMLAPYEWPALDDIALDGGTVPTTIIPEGSGPWDELDFTGIYHYGHPSPLSGTVVMDTEE